jgi:sugar O-acyltransferase (sialic acid O-acetyltransferase NeuD family)
MSGSPSTPLVIVGAGGFARETAEIVRAINAVEPRWDLLGYVDDDPARWGQIVSGALVLGGTEVLDGTDAMAVVCVGNPTHFDVRARIVDRLGMSPDRYATLVHPTVSLASSTTIGEGTVIAAHCVTTTDVEIERHVAVMPACVFTHDVHIGSFATLASGVRLAGAVTVGSGAYVG